ncbi:recombinase zinc beta ribbon domain-containing protein [Peribacillus asahii]
MVRHTLTGILKCSQCGSSMIAGITKKKRKVRIGKKRSLN